MEPNERCSRHQHAPTNAVERQDNSSSSNDVSFPIAPFVITHNHATFTLVSDSQVAKDPGQALPETELGIDLTFKIKHGGQWTVAQLIRSLLPNGYVTTMFASWHLHLLS